MHRRLASTLALRARFGALSGAALLAPVVLCGLAMPVAAQEAPRETRSGEARQEAPRPAGEVIDILAPLPDAPHDPNYEDECAREAEAGVISGEILVCARRRDDSEYRTTSDSRKRYAEETAFVGDPQAPDVAGAGIFRGPATMSGMCFIPPCPPPKAIIIDVEALPEAPLGSDADRIARGLPPLGDANPVGDAIVIPTTQAEAEAAKVAAEATAAPTAQSPNTGPVIDYATPTMDEAPLP